MSETKECSEEIAEQLNNIDIEGIKEELFEERKIVLNEPITETAIYSIWHPIEKLLSIDSKAPIKLYLHSNGGDAYTSLYISSFLESINKETPIYTIGMGAVFSGACLILMAGTANCRCVYKYSSIMCHMPKVSSDEPYTSGGQLAQAKGIDVLDEAIYDLMIKRTNMSRKLIKKKLQQDWYLSAEECIKYGIADKIM